MIKTIKKYRAPVFAKSDLESKNPTLLHGFVVFEHDDGDVNKVARRFKCGPGKWNDLPYQGESEHLFSLNQAISNPIGDATGNLFGKTPEELLLLMLNPDKVPVITNLRNDAAGAFTNTAILEIGASKSGIVNFQMNISDQQYLQGATPINITAGGLFSNEGNKGVGNIALTLASTLNPGTPQSYEIKVKATHKNGTTPDYFTYIKYAPRAIWGTSGNADIDASGVNSLSGKKTRLITDVAGQYDFNSVGYHYLCLPDMMDKANIFFVDVSVPEAPVEHDFFLLKTIQVNNGIGVYNYAIFRTTYYLDEASNTKITRAT